MRENALSDKGSGGAPTLTRVPSSRSSDKYESIGSGAETVLTIRSKLFCSVLKVLLSLVA
jgi:hypothetical protein